MALFLFLYCKPHNKIRLHHFHTNVDEFFLKLYGFVWILWLMWAEWRYLVGDWVETDFFLCVGSIWVFSDYIPISSLFLAKFQFNSIQFKLFLYMIGFRFKFEYNSVWMQSQHWNIFFNETKKESPSNSMVLSQHQIRYFVWLIQSLDFSLHNHSFWLVPFVFSKNAHFAKIGFRGRYQQCSARNPYWLCLPMETALN